MTWRRRSPYRTGAAARVPGNSTAHRAPGGTGAPLCVEQLRGIHSSAAQRQPLLLVLEDLHWAGESTLLLTEYLAPLLPDMPVLVLATYRGNDVDLHHPLARVIGQLARRRLVEQVSLRRLSSMAYARCCGL